MTISLLLSFSCQANQMAEEFLKNSYKKNSDWKSIWLSCNLKCCEYLDLPLIILYTFHQINKPLSQVHSISHPMADYPIYHILQNKTPSPFLERQQPFLLHTVLDPILRCDEDDQNPKKSDYSRKKMYICLLKPKYFR